MRGGSGSELRSQSAFRTYSACTGIRNQVPCSMELVFQRLLATNSLVAFYFLLIHYFHPEPRWQFSPEPRWLGFGRSDASVACRAPDSRGGWIGLVVYPEPSVPAEVSLQTPAVGRLCRCRCSLSALHLLSHPVSLN